MAFMKGTYVKHPIRPEWGIGVVTADERAGQVSVFFENEPNIKKMLLSHVDLTVVDEPGEARLFLENILVEDENQGVKDRKPFPEKVSHFLETFTGGLRGPVIEEHERKYKVDQHEKWKSLLNQEDFRSLLDGESWEELLKRIKACYTINLISTFEAIKFADALKGMEAQQKIAKSLYELLYGEGPVQKRFTDYSETLAVYECDKWPLVTLPLYLRFPDEYMFVKPTVTQEAAANRGFDIQYSSKVNWGTYQQILMFSTDLRQRLEAYGNQALMPRDMIDVQNFMWCTFTNGWREQEVREAESNLTQGS
jgi:hypothetical protein